MTYLVNKSKSEYGKSIRANVRRLWLGQVDTFDFVDGMITSIQRGFRRAWVQGAKQCGVLEDELTEDEQAALEQEINSDITYLLGFALAIEEGSKANGGKLTPLINRARMWVERYTAIVELAKIMACEDQKLKWTLNPAEHCKSCLKLEGKVKRASYWKNYDVRPKHWDKLDCKGGCRCSLEPTDEPISKGPLPSLP